MRIELGGGSMELLNLFSSDEELQRKFNEKIAESDLSQYNHIETPIDNTTNENILDRLKVDDGLMYVQSRNWGKQKIEVFTPDGTQVGNVPQALVDDLTFKGDSWPSAENDYDDKQFFHMLSGFAVIKLITGEKEESKLVVELYYKRD